VDGVFKQQGARRRSTDFRRGKRLGERDHLIELPKPKIRPAWMSECDYLSAPEQLTVRELYTGAEVLVTTLLCPKRTSKTDLKELYHQRWRVELDLRNTKTTLGMDLLTYKTPCISEKEIWVYLLVYNLIRVMMAQASVLAGCMPRQLSLKHTVQLWASWHRAGASHSTELLVCLP
jgi:hypothetical protein